MSVVNNPDGSAYNTVTGEFYPAPPEPVGTPTTSQGGGYSIATDPRVTGGSRGGSGTGIQVFGGMIQDPSGRVIGYTPLYNGSSRNENATYTIGEGGEIFSGAGTQVGIIPDYDPNNPFTQRTANYEAAPNNAPLIPTYDPRDGDIGGMSQSGTASMPTYIPQGGGTGTLSGIDPLQLAKDMEARESVNIGSSGTMFGNGTTPTNTGYSNYTTGQPYTTGNPFAGLPTAGDSGDWDRLAAVAGLGGLFTGATPQQLMGAALGYTVGNMGIDRLRQAQDIYGQAIGQTVDEVRRQAEFVPFGVTTNTGRVSATGSGLDLQGTEAERQYTNTMQQQALNLAQQAGGVTSQSLFDEMQALRANQRGQEDTQLENRLAAQGRLGVSTAAYGGTPEQLALAQAREQQNAQDAYNAIMQSRQLQAQDLATAQGMMQAGYAPTQNQLAILQGSYPYASMAQQPSMLGAQAMSNLGQQGLAGLVSAMSNEAMIRQGQGEQLTRMFSPAVTAGSTSGGQSGGQSAIDMFTGWLKDQFGDSGVNVDDIVDGIFYGSDEDIFEEIEELGGGS